MKKALYIVAALLTFAAADATGRKSTGDKVQVVIRGAQDGPWKAYLFGATCNGKLEIRQASQDEPVEITCR